MSISLAVEVSAFGICRGFPPHGIFVVNVQKESSQVWTVYRRYGNFLSLYEQLQGFNGNIPTLPIVDDLDVTLDHMEQARAVLCNWLQATMRDECILRTQSMYQFLCADANMPPPYVDIHWKARNDVNFNEDDMDMDFMYEKNTTEDDLDTQGFDDDCSQPFEDVEMLSTGPTNGSHNGNCNNGNGHGTEWRQISSKRTASHSAASYRKQVDLKDTDDDVAQGLDIQSLSVMEAEFVYDCDEQHDDAKMTLTLDATTSTISTSLSCRQQREEIIAPPRRIISLEAFDIIRVIGKGSFGKVFLVRDKAKKTIHAMKVLKKDYIIKKNQVQHTKTERSVLGYIRHPYIVGLQMAFQTADKLFFVLDYCSGGELFFHLGNAGRFPEDRTRFYAAQITSALEHVHMLGIVYRDLKPENVLLDSKGNVRLTDFGLSKEGVSHHATGANSFCGTPEYIAPEVLLRQGHGRAVDWWSLGALTFEMLVSLPPFYSRSRETMFENIMKAELCFPSYVSAPAKALLTQLLVRDPALRLGSGEADAGDVKAHPFFASINWDALAKGDVMPPWAPPVSGSMDTSQFDPEFTSMLPIVSPEVREAYFGTFDGFTFEGREGARLMAQSIGIGQNGHSATSSSTSQRGGRNGLVGLPHGLGQGLHGQGLGGVRAGTSIPKTFPIGMAVSMR